jgi:hypothetical protein
MTALTERHPQLMVPHVFTFGVVLYTNGSAPIWPADAIRSAMVAALPPGTGVGGVTCTSHGVYTSERG